jgi:EpsD family peptidyl-prolyl cis-trans isomerase
MLLVDGLARLGIPPRWRATRTRILLLASIGVTVALTSACGRGRAGPPDSQVAARVNGSDITVHQVQSILQRQPRLAAEQPDLAARRVLDALVEQELAAQAARSQGLEKDPDTLQALEAMRREVLARAYQDRAAAKTAGASSDEIDRFYDAQPALFSQRRILLLQEYQVELPSREIDKVKAIARDAKTTKDLDDRLAVAGLRQRSRVFAQAPEDMPLALVGQLAGLGSGQSLVVEQPGAARIFFVLHAQPAPVDRRVATDAIRAFLRTERQRQEVQRGMKALRESARIEYLGPFAVAASEPATAASAAR